MNEPVVMQRMRDMLRSFLQAAAARAECEDELVSVHQRRCEEWDSWWEARQQHLLADLHRETTAADAEFAENQLQLQEQVAAEQDGVKLAFAEAQEEIRSRFHREKTEVRKAYKDAQWSTKMVYEANKNAAKEELRETRNKIMGTSHRLKAISRLAQEYLEECRLPSHFAEPAELEPPAPGSQPRDPLAVMLDHLQVAESRLTQLQKLRLPRVFRGLGFFIAWGVLAVALSLGSAFLTYRNQQLDAIFGAGMGFLASVVIGLVVWLGLGQIARFSARKVCRPMNLAIAEGLALESLATTKAGHVYKRRLKAEQELRDVELQKASATFEPQLEEINKRRLRELRRASDNYQPQLAALQARFEFEQHRVETERESRKEEARSRYHREMATSQARYQSEREAAQTAMEQARMKLADNWRQAVAKLQQGAMALHEELRAYSPGWGERLVARTPPSQVPPALRFGEFPLDILRLPNGLPRDPTLRAVANLKLHLPALVSAATPQNVLLKAEGTGRGEAVKALQTLMLRYLTCFPPGKVRLTIIDPVGLGENFAGFMHLSDFDETLIAHRIWTEAVHIEKQLTDLTAHMESIIQKYLRNQFATIDAYNADAGEVAEPYRVLVIANFPVNFTDEAARRLLSIVQSGSRCGVLTLVSVDMGQPLPKGFPLADLEAGSVTLNWQPSGAAGDVASDVATTHNPLKIEGADGSYRFKWQDPDFGAYPLVVDAPPPDEMLTKLINLVGSAAKEAQRVEVPFDFIAPAAEKWWAGDNGSVIQVPLGRVGATRRQAITLGRGTSQHVLVAGKTGSGKSTLLHVLITNAVLNYAPEQLELYLVDFKKGVEFKPYAELALPHARVVAIESEREFGLSVLQRLDVELKKRGDLYRGLGVQDVASAREADPTLTLPRILLIVDEFQEFFTEDDRIGQEAALVLDRLVRQGRAFGIHVVLGSQTLGGAYTLARSTLDQMAVRIALPCSETDGHMILSEENNAARLLSRPGDAIYNDMSGQVEGNHPFQVAWLPDERREELLVQVQRRARERTDRPAPPEPIVFEGNTAAHLGKHHRLRELLKTRRQTPAKEVLAWLGDPIAIKEPTAAIFRPQNGRHLLLIGQNEDEAQGVLFSAFLSIVAQASSATRVHLLTSAPESDELKVFKNTNQLRDVGLHIYGARDQAAALQELADLVDRRIAAGPENEAASSDFVFLHGIHRLRELRRVEDDYSFGSTTGPATPPQNLVKILREGAAVGVHVIAWADALAGVLRCFDRPALREFEMRVLFQMNPSDSSNLIDTPLASKLGLHRGLFVSEDTGKLEKFRPYGVPTLDELTSWISG